MTSAEKENVTKDWLRQMARLIGLDLDDQRVEALLPQFERSLVGARRLDEMNLDGVEPSNILVLDGD